MQARERLFREYTFAHRLSAYGEISQQLIDLAVKHPGGIAVYSFLQGLELSAAA